jgi:hypothetical protein
MATKNAQFLQALQTVGWVRTIPDPTQRAQTEKDLNDALDALLRADPNNKDEFRRAIFAHRGFWGRCAGLEGLQDKVENDVVNDEFLNPDDLENPILFQGLHKLAAEQRVRNSLYKVDNNVLIGILSNNPDVCRAYLAEKAELGLLKEVKGWQPNVMVPGPTGGVVPANPPQNKSTDVFTNETVKRVQVDASQVLLYRLIEDSTDKVALKKLLAATNQGELNTAMQALGFPPSALPPTAPTPHIVHPLSSVSWLHNFAIAREKDVRQTWVKDNFEAYVNSLSEEDLLAKKETLEKKPKFFSDGLDEPFKTESSDLSEKEIKELRGILGARYLQVVFSRNDDTALEALNAEDGGLVNEINDFLYFDEEDGYKYVKEAVTSNPSLIRQGILQGLIRNLDTDPANLKILSEMSSAKTLEEFKEQLENLGITNVDWIEEDAWQEMQEWSHSKAIEMIQDQVLRLPNNPGNQAILKEINTAKNIEEFRAGLKKIGIDPVDWITRGDKDDIQKLTRPHAFKIHIANAKFGPEFRPELLAALDKLPPEKQEALLAKPEQLRHLVNAKDANAVKFYLGRDAEGIEEVVSENVRLAGFQQLHSVPIAKALAKCELGITLDDKQIKAINKIIYNYGAGFTDMEAYKTFVNKISVACGIPAGNEAFYKAFDLNKDGTALLSNDANTVADPIINQHDYNKDTYAAYISTTDTKNKQILRVLLCIEKTKALDNTALNKIDTHFKNSPDLKTFLDKIGTDPSPAIKELKAGMGHELNAISFNQLKIQSWAAPLRGTNMVAFNQAVTQMDQLLENMRATRAPYGDIAVKFQFLDDVNPIHLANASFITECKDDPDGMRAKFGGMTDQCDLIVDRLLRNQAMLEAQLASLPTLIPGGVDLYEREDQILDLRARLKEELEQTKRNLAIFQAYQQKLSGPSGILKAIDNAIGDKKNDYYEPASFTTTIIKAGNTITTSPTTGTAPPLVSATINSGSSKVNNFLTGDRLGPGDKCEYKMNHVVTNGTPPTTFKAQGKFVETHDTAPPAPSKVKGGQITKQPQCTFVVEEPPTQTHPLRTPQSPPDGRLNDAKVNFYMGMAVSILSRFDPKNPPSKDNPIRLNVTSEEDMKHLWTALVIVGEKNAKNMRFGRDAIIVESGPFNPAKERGMLGFTKESYYTQYKKEYGNIIDAKVTDAKGMAKKQTDHIDSVKHAEQGMDKFKKGMNDIRTTVDESAKVREEQGPAPETTTVVFRK